MPVPNMVFILASYGDSLSIYDNFQSIGHFSHLEYWLKLTDFCFFLVGSAATTSGGVSSTKNDADAVSIYRPYYPLFSRCQSTSLGVFDYNNDIYTRMSNLLLAVAAIKDTIIDNRDTISVVVGALSSLIVGVLAFLSGKKKAAKSEFSELVAANIKFRDEIKAELNDARIVIDGLKKTIEEKGKLIEEMQTSLADLKQQLIVKETRISDMQMDMIKKDYQIQILQDKSR